MVYGYSRAQGRPVSAGGAHQYPWGTVPHVDAKPSNPYSENEYGVGYLPQEGGLGVLGSRPLSSASTFAGGSASALSFSRPNSSNTVGYNSRPASRTSAGFGAQRRARSGSGAYARPQSSRPQSSYATNSRGVPREVHRARPLTGLPRSQDRWHGLGHDQQEQLEERRGPYESQHRALAPRSEYTRSRSAPRLRAPPPPPRSATFSSHLGSVHEVRSPEVRMEMNPPVVPRLMPLRTASASLSGMKREIATVKANADEIVERADSARGHIEDFRSKHDFPAMCEELKATLWPEIIQARAEITDIFEEIRMGTYEIQQQVDLLKHEKNSIAYVLYRMDQKLDDIERTIGHR